VCACVIVAGERVGIGEVEEAGVRRQVSGWEYTETYISADVCNHTHVWRYELFVLSDEESSLPYQQTKYIQRKFVSWVVSPSS